MYKKGGVLFQAVVNVRTAWRFVENVRDISTSVQINPLVPEYKILAKTINARDKNGSAQARTNVDAHYAL